MLYSFKTFQYLTSKIKTTIKKCAINSFMTETVIIVETSPLICSANQWTGFYMITTSVMNELSKKISFNTCHKL